jgi:hypothetical protein
LRHEIYSLPRFNQKKMKRKGREKWRKLPLWSYRLVARMGNKLAVTLYQFANDVPDARLYLVS